MELRQATRKKRLSRKAAQLPLWKESRNKSVKNAAAKPSRASTQKSKLSVAPTKKKNELAIAPSEKKSNSRKSSRLEIQRSKKSEKPTKKGLQTNLERTSSKVSSNSISAKDIKASVSASEMNLGNNSKKSSRKQSTFCTICKKKVDGKNLLKKHITKHHFLRHCPNCPKTFRQTRKFILHLRSHLLDHPYECKVCLESYNQKKDMLAHTVLHKPRTLSCDICAETYPHLASLNRHRLTHSGPPYPCDDCEAIFSNVPDRTVHSKNHVHRCLLCPNEVVAFPTNADLAAHMYRNHQTQDYNPTEFEIMDAYQPCVSTGAVQLEDDGLSDSMDDCESSDCESDADLDSNYQIDAVESVYNLKRKDKFICFLCYDLYPSRELLISHMKAHNWFPCNLCPSFFPYADELNKHKSDCAERLSISSRCQVCNSECAECKKNCKTMDVISKADSDVLKSFEYRFPELYSFQLIDYTNVTKRNRLINFIEYMKCYEGPLFLESFSRIGFHHTSLQVIIKNPVINRLFPRECICELEELCSKFENLINILVERFNPVLAQ